MLCVRTPELIELRREIRSFVMRAGRLTEGQTKGWERGFPRYGLQSSDGVLDWDLAFSQPGRRVLEIGFGMGDSLVEMACADPATNFVGIEVHRPGVGRLLSQVLERELDNLRVYEEDAVPVLRDCIAPASLDGLHLYFPDPWHKKKHNKRRIIQADFISLAVERMAPDGIIHLATDWAPYAEHMLEVMEQAVGLENCAGSGQYSPRPDYRPDTKFERRGERLGHGVWDLLYRRR